MNNPAVSLIAKNLADCIELYITDRKNLSTNTVRYYRGSLSSFFLFCSLMGIKQVDQLDASLIKRYLITLENQGYNAGGVHAKWRAVRAFMNWYAIKTGWSVPAITVRLPKMQHV